LEWGLRPAVTRGPYNRKTDGSLASETVHTAGSSRLFFFLNSHCTAAVLALARLVQ
jgi:hypothetical protein